MSDSKDIVLFETEDKNVTIEVAFDEETVMVNEKTNDKSVRTRKNRHI